MLLLSAGPASAIVVRSPDGKMISYRPVVGSKAATAANIFDTVFSNVDYSGGPVMPSNTNYTIVWEPSNYTGSPFQTSIDPAQDYVAGVNQFFSDLAHDSGLPTNSDSVSSQYNDANRNTAAYNSTFGGSFTDTDPLPDNGCPALPGDVCLTEAQLQSELDRFLSAHSLPRDLTHEYFLLTPPGVASCMDAAGTMCSANADQNRVFCAYHANSATSVSFVYANIPDYDGIPGCDPYVTFCAPGPCDYPNSYADGVLSGVSHEHNESITDPQPDDAWADWQPRCASNPTSPCGEEIGDKCNGAEGTDPNTIPNFQPDGNDAPYNQVINGRGYWLQPEWSNQTYQCLDFWSSNGASATASFSQSPGSETTVNFDATGSTATGGVAEYVWQFNDAPGQPAENTTIETTQPTISHTFPQAGTYVVALTVMGSDGTSNGIAQTMSIAPPPTTSPPTTTPTTSPPTTQPPATTTTLAPPTTPTTLPCATARCTLGAALMAPACAGQVIPASVTRKFSMAENLIDQAATSPPKKAPKLQMRAKTALKGAMAKATQATKGRKPKISSDCAAALGRAADSVLAGCGKTRGLVDRKAPLC
jgi:hypothetical protein